MRPRQLLPVWSQARCRKFLNGGRGGSGSRQTRVHSCICKCRGAARSARLCGVGGGGEGGVGVRGCLRGVGVRVCLRGVGGGEGLSSANGGQIPLGA